MASKALNFYLQIPVKELQRIVLAHQEEFDALIGDTFSEEELKVYEKMLDEISSVDVQPIFTELSFDDFYADPKQECKQRFFFETCQSSLCLDNLPYLDANPFQVTYLIDLLWSLDEVLIDRGGVNELMFKKAYLEEIKKYKTMEVFIKDDLPKVVPVKTKAPVHPMDFLILDVYKEIERLKENHVGIPISDQSEKIQKIYSVMSTEKLSGDELFSKTGLIAKDFGDNLERLKFFLRKIN
jgi:hypothetical protein